MAEWRDEYTMELREQTENSNTTERDRVIATVEATSNSQREVIERLANVKV